VLQHTPSTQNCDVHWSFVAHDAPSVERATHWWLELQ
jgi:hypothetical protein